MSLSLPILVNRFSSSTTISIHIIDKNWRNDRYILFRIFYR
jgi:hypothetical protein